MNKLRDLAKKGGVESIVAVIVLVGLVLLLIVFAILPTINQAEDSAGDNTAQMSTLNSKTKANFNNALNSIR